METTTPPAGAQKDQRTSRTRRTPLILLLIFLFLLLFGIAVDEPVRVLEQALSVCLSCIGID